MSSRESILTNVLKSQPAGIPLPELNFEHDTSNLTEKYIEVLKRIGGNVFEAQNLDEVKKALMESFPGSKRKVTTLTELSDFADLNTWKEQDPHSLEDIEVAIIKAHLGVAENGAVWITEELLVQRVVAFICQQLVVVVSKSDLVPTMHQAYQKIGEADYNYGAFIAGPSKTADIEQSLVLGAHGPKSMTVFIVG